MAAGSGRRTNRKMVPGMNPSHGERSVQVAWVKSLASSLVVAGLYL